MYLNSAYSYELYHHGIKGMKWGIRRFQKKDGTLTSAGKKRYADDSTSSNSAKSEKSTHRSRLEAKYMERGMTAEHAKAAADKRIKTEKIIAITAGLTLAAAAAYVINKNVKERTDYIIKSGTTMQRITSSDTEDLNRAFYASYEKRDMDKYRGMYGKQVQIGYGKAYRVTLKADKDVRIASRQKASEAFADLYRNDSEFRDSFKKSNEKFAGLFGHKVHQVASGEMTDRQLRRAGYDAFNRSLVNHDSAGTAASKKFYDKLKSMGYDAIMDINDQKYSGYSAKKPVIVFNKADKISISKAVQMSPEQVASNFNREFGKMSAKTVAEVLSIYGGIGAGIAAVGKIRNQATVNRYREQNPGTKLTDKQILAMLNNQRR